LGSLATKHQQEMANAPSALRYRRGIEAKKDESEVSNSWLFFRANVWQYEMCLEKLNTISWERVLPAKIGELCRYTN
jgi:hypothetical protein